MRCALIPDIHGNPPALEAVVAHIAQQADVAIYHMGDLVGYRPWPNETLVLLRGRMLASPLRSPGSYHHLFGVKPAPRAITDDAHHTYR